MILKLYKILILIGFFIVNCVPSSSQNSPIFDIFSHSYPSYELKQMILEKL